MAYMNMQIYSWRHSKESKRIDQGFSLHFLSDHCAMSQDVLLLLEAGFTDPTYPGERFICPDGAPIEGLLASDPARAAVLEVHRLPFPKPRQVVVAALYADHQSLPVLILGDALPLPEDVLTLSGKHFVTDTRRILDLLAQRHGFPKVH